MALARLQMIARSSQLLYPTVTRTYSIDPPSGSIREGGGAMSKREKALEDQYFKRLEQEKLAALKKAIEDHHEEEIEHHEDAIEELEEQIARHKERIARHKQKMKQQHHHHKD